MNILRVIKENEIIRRYMTINSFDGALTIFGILMADFIAGITDPVMVLLPCFGAAFAMCISGIWGAYAAETAEVKKSIKELEKHLLRSLHGTRRHKEHQKISLIVGLVDGLSPLVTALIIIIPIFLAKLSVITINEAYYYSFSLIAVILFLLGVFLGKIAKENIIKNGIKMVLAGIVISILFYLMHFIGLL